MFKLQPSRIGQALTPTLNRKQTIELKFDMNINVNIKIDAPIPESVKIAAPIVVKATWAGIRAATEVIEEELRARRLQQEQASA